MKHFWMVLAIRRTVPLKLLYWLELDAAQYPCRRERHEGYRLRLGRNCGN
jgi:hypothetical protein